MRKSGVDVLAALADDLFFRGFYIQHVSGEVLDVLLPVTAQEDGVEGLLILGRKWIGTIRVKDDRVELLSSDAERVWDLGG